MKLAKQKVFRSPALCVRSDTFILVVQILKWIDSKNERRQQKHQTKWQYKKNKQTEKQTTWKRQTILIRWIENEINEQKLYQQQHIANKTKITNSKSIVVSDENWYTPMSP